MDRFVNYRSKIERREERVKRTVENRMKVSLDPVTPLELTISQQFKESRESWREIEVERAITLYNNARSNRHDIWCEFIEITAKSNKYKINDIRISDFIRETLKNTTVIIPDNIRNLTPDILVLHESRQFIYLGDVACTDSYANANQRKHIKYSGVRDFLQNVLEIKVKYMNFIITNDLNNVDLVVSEFNTNDLIVSSLIDSERAKHFFRLCVKTMETAKTLCSDKHQFDIIQNRLDKITIEGVEGVELYEDIVWESMPDRTEVDTVAEMAIINQIKNEVRRQSKLFDKGYEDTKNAFNKLHNQNKALDHCEPKSTVKACYNLHEINEQTDLNLLSSYIKDIHTSHDEIISAYITSILPSVSQIEVMGDYKKLPKEESRAQCVFGKYQYTRPRRVINNNYPMLKFLDSINRGKKTKNAKEAPKCVDPGNYNMFHDDITSAAKYLGQISPKPPFLNDEFLAKTNAELENMTAEKDAYDYARKTNAAQLANSMSNLYQRLMHLKTSLSTKDNVYIPPNGAFICVIPKEHAPVVNSNCDIPMIFITRFLNTDTTISETGNEYEYKIKTEKWTYLISKLCRLNLDKIKNWDQAGYKLVACASYILSATPRLVKVRDELIGCLCLLILDCHQKTSEFLDLLKYVAYMPFAELTCLSKLILDKFNIMVKTKLDAWVLTHIEQFMLALSTVDLINAKKPKIQIINGEITRDSLGLDLELPSFTNQVIKHATIMQFIEEVTMYNIVRGKHLYGSQFMDKAITSTAEWNLEYLDEIEKYGDWVVGGKGNGHFPFQSKFAYSADAIKIAQRHFYNNSGTSPSDINKNMASTMKNNFIHYNCSLRGCVKEPEERRNNKDIHTTSLESCLNYYEKKEYIDRKCEVQYVASELIRNGKQMEFSMSEKDQRGGGRPIATPTLLTKAALMMVEKPEIAIGKASENNIIVEGKNKLQEQCNAYKNLINVGVNNHCTQIYQLTEDQTKYSENDNTRKYIPYIEGNPYLPDNIRRTQLTYLKKIINRKHHVSRIPRSFKDNPKLDSQINHNDNTIKGIIGWPQGMLNFISTSVHSIADVWITHAYNKAYPNNKVYTKGLVHSDDSWCAVACNNPEDFKQFAIFRTVAKQLFCLKANKKKLWGSKIMGELVSNYNINGNVHLSISKTVANSFQNLVYQNYPLDVQGQISSLQQAYRNGATIGTITILGTILKQQVLNCYQVSGYQRENIDILPVELGGYPTNSCFELAVTGVQCHYQTVLNQILDNPNSKISQIILKVSRLSIKNDVCNEILSFRSYIQGKLTTNIIENHSNLIHNEDQSFNEDDYASVILPNKSTVFSCIKYLLPQSIKVAKTVGKIKSLPFETDGLELIVPRPNSLKVALGHLKSQLSTMLYNLAAEKYTQSARRLAINQSIQSSGKSVRLNGFPPMTINELLYFIHNLKDIDAGSVDMIRTSFAGDNDIISLTNTIVYNSEQHKTNNDKRKIINKIPKYDDSLKTTCKIRDVLLYMIDSRKKTQYQLEYGSNIANAETLKEDAELLRRRFYHLFKYYETVKVCGILMQMWNTRIKSKLWMQPYLRVDSLSNFLCDLYGKTLNTSVNFHVEIQMNEYKYHTVETDIVSSLYTVSILNEMYPGKFIPTEINNKDVETVIKTLDYTKLSQVDYLKYGILRKVYYNEDNHLRLYDEQKEYRQYYMVRQAIVNGRYTGKFKIAVSYGSLKAIIEGDECDVTMTVNKTNISDILKMMKVCVDKNFPYYKYSSPNLWCTSEFWNTRNKFFGQFLVSYSSACTLITNRATPQSVSISVDPALKIPITVNRYDIKKIILEECNRTVSKIIGGVSGDRKIRIDNVSQSLICPMAKNIELIPDLIEGYSNTTLLSTKIIINLALQKHCNTGRQELIELLKSKLTGFDAECLMDFYHCLLNKFSNKAFSEDWEFATNGDLDDVAEEIIITGETVTSFLNNDLITTAEDLTTIEQDFTLIETEQIGRIVIYNNITKFICKLISPSVTEIDIESILWYVLSDPITKEKMIEDIKNPDMLEIIESQRSYLSEQELDVGIYTMLIGNDMTSREIWDKVDINRIIKSKVPLSNKQIHFDIGRKLLESIKEMVLDITDDDEDDELFNLI